MKCSLRQGCCSCGAALIEECLTVVLSVTVASSSVFGSYINLHLDALPLSAQLKPHGSANHCSTSVCKYTEAANVNRARDRAQIRPLLFPSGNRCHRVYMTGTKQSQPESATPGTTCQHSVLMFVFSKHDKGHTGSYKDHRQEIKAYERH